MAKKRRKPERAKSKRGRRAQDLPEIPDQRAMKARMWGDLASAAGDSSLERAQQIMYQAFEARTEKRRLDLARKALTICPDCADAYVLLAEHAPSRKEALHWFEQGVAAGERALGPQVFQEAVGDFWGILETRPYMRARQGLAFALWAAGRREEAVQHVQEMLRLNPNDNQGLRYTLASFLLFLDRDEDLARLLQQYPDEGMATWAYTKALLAFRQHGDQPAARQLLKEAITRNKHVPAYLLGEKYPPAEQPGYYGLGDENEALTYIASFMAAWKSTPGAIAWLRANVKTKKRPAGTPRLKGPLGSIKKRLKERVRQEDTLWQADFRQMPTWIRIAGQMVRPWMVLVTDPTKGLVLAHQLSEETPSAALLWDTLVQAMQQPVVGRPHRPTAIQVRPDDLWDALRSDLSEIGVELDSSSPLDQLQEVFQDMCEHVCGNPPPGLLDVPGITPEQVGSFYEAAAAFFRQAPWKKVGYESAIQVRCDKFSGGPWYGVLMGQSGLTMGLALYEDLDILRQMWATGSDEENAKRSVATSVTFGEEWDIPVADLEAAKQYGWQVARPDAYPEVMHKERGLSMRPPLAWELELMEGCLRAVPEFVTRRRQDNPTEEEFTVSVASGLLKLMLAWVVDTPGV